MDYYEELGITPTATEEEIRRAHRRLTKLVHPDQQTDEGLKQLAETQMRRLNSIVDILCDPERRRLYDEQLRQGLGGFGALNLRAQPQRRTLHSLPFWVASTICAVVLTLGAVWFWADNWGSSFGNRSPTYIPSEATAEAPPAKPAQNAPATRAPATTAPPQAQVESAPEPQTAQSQPPPSPPKSAPAQPTDPTANLDSRTVTTVPTPAHTNKPVKATMNPAHETEQPERAMPVRKRLNLVNAEVAARAHPVETDVPPPPSVPTAVPANVDTAVIPESTIPVVATKFPEPATHAKVKSAVNTARMSKAARQNALEGEWVYAPTQPEKKKPGFYPPEFIDLKLFSADGGLHGQYRAKYQVTDRPIPPDVAFTLTPDTGTNKFVWKSSNGSKGTLKISSIDASSIRIEWRTTVFSNGPALTAGTATLVRRAQ